MGVAPDLVKRVPLFAGLSNRDLKKVAASLTTRSFKSGQPIMVEGDGGAGFFLIEDGRARVTIRGRDVQLLGPGDCFGEIALITKANRTATVTAEGDLRCYGMTHWDFRALVKENPSVAWKLLETLAQRLAETE
ncbi:MAG: Crp/Fnr family transcriptional regulator [Gaiellaceae bacterium]